MIACLTIANRLLAQSSLVLKLTLSLFSHFDKNDMRLSRCCSDCEQPWTRNFKTVSRLKLDSTIQVTFTFDLNHVCLSIGSKLMRDSSIFVDFTDKDVYILNKRDVILSEEAAVMRSVVPA